MYAAFPDLPADAGVTARVLDLLPQLEAGAFADRDAASRALAAAGPPGVLAVLRLDSAAGPELGAEQRGRLNRLLDAGRRRDFPDGAAAGGDVGFLVECLDDPDRAVRDAARRALEKRLGRSVRFDAALDGEARRAAVTAVRREVLPRRAARPIPAEAPAAR